MVKKKVVSKYLGREPDQLPVTERRAQHLSEISGVDVHKITGKKIADVHKLLKWKVDSKLLLFRRICGQLVKKNPATGEMEPVPNATVHVEETDCSFLGFFPTESCDDGTDCDLNEFLASSSITIDDLAVLASTYTGRNSHDN